MDNNLPLPLEKVPKCWHNEERMNALFSPFRSISTNPQDWITKYKFWQNLIYEWLKYNTRCSFSISDLNDAFKLRGCTPSCLVTVIEELHRNNEVIPEAEFLKEPFDSWTAWSIDLFVKKPLSWSLSKVKSYIINNEVIKETKYIHLQVIKELGNIVFLILEEKKENVVISFSQILKCCQTKIDTHISDNTVILILMWLRYQKKIIFSNNKTEDELLIKIITPLEGNITEIDVALYKLIKQENELLKNIEVMEKEKNNIISETKLYLSKGLRQMAKSHLRKKIKLEDTIKKQVKTLDNIQNLISNIQNSRTNTTVLSAYKTGSNALRKLHNSDLSESNVRDIMDNLSKALEEQKEVQFVISETIHNDDSDTDLQQELIDLIALDESNFPSVPNSELNSVNKLEDKLDNLHLEVTTASNVSPNSSKSTPNKKILADLKCT